MCSISKNSLLLCVEVLCLILQYLNCTEANCCWRCTSLIYFILTQNTYTKYLHRISNHSEAGIWKGLALSQMEDDQLQIILVEESEVAVEKQKEKWLNCLTSVLDKNILTFGALGSSQKIMFTWASKLVKTCIKSN